MRRRQQGYSLLELSIVLVITGILAGSSLLLGVSQMENTRKRANEKKLDAIETALMAFRTLNGRLPCPAAYTPAPSNSSFGVQVADPGICTGAPFGPADEVVEGAVPVRTLGLSDDYIYDAWGRKFAYAVDRRMTSTNVFRTRPTNETCGNITVNDQSGAARSAGAVYVLLSYGPTGHGGYIQGSTRNSTGSTNANEQQNCNCNNLAVATSYDATYVQRDTVETGNVSTAFDDILRYKERWQLASIDDNVKANDVYYGPELLVGTASSDYAYAYRITCDEILSFAEPDTFNSDELVAIGIHTEGGIFVSGEQPGGAINSMMFSKDNDYVAMAGSGVLDYLKIYKRSGLALDLLSQPDFAPNSAANSVAFTTHKRYLAVGTTLTPFLYIYKRDDDAFTKLEAPDTLPAAKVNGVAFSPNGIHLIVAQNQASSKILRIYKFGDENYQLQSNQPTQPAGTVAYGPSFSYDSLYLAVGTNSTPYLTLYQRYIDTFTKLSDLASTPGSTVYHTAWSHDAGYLAAASASSPYIHIYKRSGTTFTKLANPADLPTGTAYHAAWSRYGVYLVVAHATSPFITVYKRVDDTFTKLDNPSTLPTSTALSAAFYVQ